MWSCCSATGDRTISSANKACTTTTRGSNPLIRFGSHQLFLYLVILSTSLAVTLYIFPGRIPPSTPQWQLPRSQGQRTSRKPRQATRTNTMKLAGKLSSASPRESTFWWFSVAFSPHSSPHSPCPQWHFSSRSYSTNSRIMQSGRYRVLPYSIMRPLTAYTLQPSAFSAGSPTVSISLFSWRLVSFSGQNIRSSSSKGHRVV